jgi:hypothetical protein
MHRTEQKAINKTDPDRAANPLSSGKTVPTKAPNGGQLRRRGPHLRLQVGATGAAIVIWAVSTGCCSVARVARVARVAPLGSEISRLQPRRGQQRPLARIASSVGCSAATPPKSRASQGFVRASWCSGAAFRASLRLAKRSKSLVASVRSDIFSSPAGAPSCARRVIDEWSEKDRENTPSGLWRLGSEKRWSRGSWPAGDSKVLSSTRRAFSCFWDLEAENG